MIVYSDRNGLVGWKWAAEQLGRQLAALDESPSVEGFRNLLINFGEFESGIMDARSPEQNTHDRLTESLRATGLRTGRLLYDSWRGFPVRTRDLHAIREVLDSLAAIPEFVPKPVSEGYAFYSVYPEMYFRAAERAIETAGSSIVCIGIRSIGTSLSSAVGAVAQAAGHEVRSFTLRPRGHPFSRTITMSETLAHAFRNLPQAHFWIADEGPGLSGSSFACVVNLLQELGIKPEQIMLFPSWIAPSERLISPEAQRVWSFASKSTSSFEETWIDSGELARHFGCVNMRDVSAANWRSFVYSDLLDHPPVQPEHESRKYLCTIKSSRKQYLLKFEGLAAYGTSKRERAEQLADAGLGSRPAAFSAGFLLAEFIDGRPLSARDASTATLDSIAQYLAAVARLFPTDRAIPWNSMVEMLRTNLQEGLGPHWCDQIELLENFENLICDSSTTAIDGRMLPHEWIHTSTGLLKTDALDHHCDHFFPGCQDAAWDVAATIVEFHLDESAKEYLLNRLEHYGFDCGVRARLPFYTCAYLAFRLGYATLAKDTMAQSNDRERFAAAARWYGTALASAVRHAVSCWSKTKRAPTRYDNRSDSSASSPARSLVP